MNGELAGSSIGGGQPEGRPCRGTVRRRDGGALEKERGGRLQGAVKGSGVDT